MTREILRLRIQPDRIASAYMDDLDDEVLSALEDTEFFVIKSHHPTTLLRLLFRVTHAPVILTVREPRDAVASLMLRFGLSFGDASTRVAQSCRDLKPLIGQPGITYLRYEEGFTADPTTVEAIASALGILLSPPEINEVFHHFTPDAVRAVVAGLYERGAFSDAAPAETFDLETHWHPSHVGDGQVGKWRSVLSEAEAAHVLYETRAYRALCHYGVDPVGNPAQLSFGSDGYGCAYLMDGFSHPEPCGVWSVDDESLLRIELKEPVKDGVSLELKCLLSPALRAASATMITRLVLNDYPMLELQSSPDNQPEIDIALVKDGSSIAGHQRIELRIEVSGAMSPADCGAGGNLRRLGLGIKRLRLAQW